MQRPSIRCLASSLAFVGCIDPEVPFETAADPEAEARRFKRLGLYVEPSSNAATQADLWAVDDPAGAARMEVIASQQIGIWVGDWIADPTAFVDDAVTRAGSQLQTLVVYNIPDRDCGFWSAGGAENGSAYTQFVDAVAAGLAGRPALVVLEPDALPLLDDCALSDVAKAERVALMAYAVDVITAAGGRVYLDAGDSAWMPAATMATRLTDAGVANARGFSLNVSHTETTDDEIAYAEEIRAIVGTDAHYLIDTGRNGLGPTWDHAWCNPSGRALGDFPTLRTGVVGLDAKLWVKPPGESDGACNGGPPAGHWWPEYADDLAEMAGF